MKTSIGKYASALAVLLVSVFYLGKAQTPAPAPAAAPLTKVARLAGADPSFPISAGVWVPASSDTLYLSGNVPPVTNTTAPKGSIESYGNTEAQTVAVLQRIEATLKSQNLTLGDVVMMHAYLVGDPSKENKMDFAGFMAGYTKYFGTKEQPNKPSRSTFQVAGLASPGILVELEVIAVRPH